MVRGLLSFGGITLAVGLVLSAGLQASGRVDLIGLLRGLPEVDASFQRGFRSDAMGRINRLRQPAGVDEVRGDESIQAFLEEFVARQSKPQDLELEAVFDALQHQFPGAQYLAANLVTSRDREELLGKLAGWTAVANPEFDAINTTVFRAHGRLGALAVMSRRIPEFSIQAANETGGRFHNRCPHCGVIHALELDRDSRTLILSCPHCDLPFEVLAVDTRGRIRRAMEFLEGFSLPAPPKTTASSDEEKILALWRVVAERCEYELDQDRADDSGDGNREVWKTSAETWAEASGDCEDTSILLADVLIEAGFEARVAIGWNGNIGQHAWVVVKAGDRQYLLETTLQKDIGREDLSEVAAAASFYQPEQLFDREQIYYSTARPERFTKDYFAKDVWKPVPHGGSRVLTQR
jgi:hypothetical protein